MYNKKIQRIQKEKSNITSFAAKSDSFDFVPSETLGVLPDVLDTEGDEAKEEFRLRPPGAGLFRLLFGAWNSNQ